MEHYIYLALNLGSIAVPLAFSFEKNVAFYKRWLSLFLAIFITSGVFIYWDIVFTFWEIWSFNPDYLLGINIVNLPLEECLFFICIPYACLFIYDSLKYYIKKDFLFEYGFWLAYPMMFGLLLLAFFKVDQSYTFAASIVGALLLWIHLKIFKNKHLGRFYIALAVHFIPFWIVNGFLTSLPVVEYNDHMNMGRMSSWLPIPWDDHIYSFDLLLMNVTLYEGFNRLFKKRAPHEIKDQ